MIGVAVAQDEAVVAVGHHPVDHPDAGVAADLADRALGHIEPMVEDRHIVAALGQEAAVGGHAEDGGLQVAAQHRLARRLGREVAAREVAQGAGPGMLADLQAVQDIIVDLAQRDGLGDPQGLGAILRGDQLVEVVDLQAERLEHRPPAAHAAWAEGLGQAALGQDRVVGEVGVLGPEAGRQGGVTQDDLHFGVAQRQGRRKGALQDADRAVAADVAGDQHPSAPPRPALGPGTALRHEAGPVWKALGQARAGLGRLRRGQGRIRHRLGLGTPQGSPERGRHVRRGPAGGSQI